MSDRKKASAKKRIGRPPTGHDPIMYVRVPVATQEAIRAWAERNNINGLSEAVRYFIDQGLERDIPKSERRKPPKRDRRTETAEGQ
jgi:hypothetical protein